MMLELLQRRAIVWGACRKPELKAAIVNNGRDVLPHSFNLTLGFCSLGYVSLRAEMESGSNENVESTRMSPVICVVDKLFAEFQVYQLHRHQLEESRSSALQPCYIVQSVLCIL
jgi:hypothetical protein